MAKVVLWVLGVLAVINLLQLLANLKIVSGLSKKKKLNERIEKYFHITIQIIITILIGVAIYSLR